MSVTGIEVEGIDVPEEGLKIVVGEVTDCRPHQILIIYRFAK